MAVTFDLSATTNSIGSLTVHLQDGAGAAAAIQFEILLGSATHANNLTGNEADNLIVGGISGDQLTGGGGSDILVGGWSGDTLWGDSGTDVAGRDLLFGGPGGDTLHGGDEDDLLASGGFDYTSPLDRTALEAIRLAWRSQTPYADLVATLTAGVGPANQYQLNASTYQADANVDTLFGELESDGFLVDDPAEVSDVAVGETVTDLG